MPESAVGNKKEDVQNKTRNLDHECEAKGEELLLKSTERRSRER